MIASFSGENRWLSNFSPAGIFYNHIGYPTTEHAYQASKSGNVIEREMISKLRSPGDAKRAGRKIMHPRSDWNEETKLQIMYQINVLKFAGIKEYCDKLLATGNQEIIEGNTWGDVFWGVCNGVGENNLGKIIMRIREEIKEWKNG